jgi:hypothetical protein
MTVKNILIPVLFAGVFLSVLFWGLSRNNRLIRTEYEKECLITERKEQAHVIQKKSAIYSRPNADRDQLLGRMYAGQL